MRKYFLLWSAAAFGVALHLAGLGLDAYLHSRDSTLAAREGLFTLSNPGHALILAGFALTAASLMGVALAWLNTRQLGGQGTAARVLRTVTLPVVGLTAAGAVWFTSLGAGASHTHAHLEPASASAATTDTNATDTAVTAGHSHPAANAAAQSANPMGEGAAHSHGAEVAITPDQLVAAADFYARVKVSAARYENVKDGVAAGYIQITQDLPGIAAHFYHPLWSRDGRVLDPDRPEVLLYTKRLDGDWRLVGFMFMDESVKEAPPSFFGALDVWHRHENLCFTAAGVSIKESRDACAGVFTAETAWQMHVWTAPGATTGVFAHDFPPISPGAFPGAVRAAVQDLVVRAP